MLCRLLSSCGVQASHCGGLLCCWGVPSGTSGKEPACQCGDVRDVGSILRGGRCPGEGHGNPYQCSCLENPTDRGATVQRVLKSWTQSYTHTHTHTHTHTGSRTHRLQELWHRGSVVSPGPRAQAHVSGTWASLISSTWDLPGSGIKPMSPELASGFFTTEPPVKPLRFLNIFEFCKI